MNIIAWPQLSVIVGVSDVLSHRVILVLKVVNLNGTLKHFFIGNYTYISKHKWYNLHDSFSPPKKKIY